MTRISERRKQILNFIQGFKKEKRYSPSIREIMRGCKISSPAVVQHHLKILEREGHIAHVPDVSRSITLIDGDQQTVRIPLLGYIAAGEPLPVFQPDSWSNQVLETLELPAGLIGVKDNIYALKVKGVSMIDALIDDNDFVIMQGTRTAQNGEMVAVWLRREREVTLKKIYQEKGRIRLQPANREMKPFYADPENVEIQGRVIAVFRRF
jgi:repressor LexA